jgi:hypothetical protein
MALRRTSDDQTKHTRLAKLSLRENELAPPADAIDPVFDKSRAQLVQRRITFPELSGIDADRRRRSVSQLVLTSRSKCRSYLLLAACCV